MTKSHGLLVLRESLQRRIFEESTKLKSIKLSEPFVSFVCFVVRPYCFVKWVT